MESLKVLIKKKTEVKSATTIPFTTIRSVAKQEQVLNIEDLKELAIFQQVTMISKVIKINDVETIGNGKRKQDIIVADATGILCGKNKLGH